MAHFAKIENNKVVQVIVVDNKNLDGKEFPESEPVGQAFIKSIGLPGEWLQTSYNNNFRVNYAGLDYTYDLNRDAFIPPQPFPSWTLNEDSLQWDAPKPFPLSDGDELLPYFWDEDAGDWALMPDYDVE